MQTKYEKYEQLAEETLSELASSKGKWQDFLSTSSRMYKYTFDEQVLIYAQRPETRACASFDFWTSGSKMNCHVKRGSNSISLLDRERKKLYYVTAMEDVEPRKNGKSKNPEKYIWRLRDDASDDINAALCRQFKLSGISISDTIASITKLAVSGQILDYDEELAMLHAKFSSDVPISDLKAAFIEILNESALYTAMKRCGLNTDNHFSENSFSKLHYFDSPELTLLIGKASGDISRSILRQIERTVHEQYKIERSKYYGRGEIGKGESGERNTLRSGRENSGIQSGLSGRGGGSEHRTLRENEGEIPEGTLRSNLLGNAAEEYTDSTPDINRRTSMGNGTEDSQGNGRSGRNERGTENERPARMGRQNEQLPSSSGRNNNERADLRLNQHEAAESADTSAAFSDFSEKIHSAFNEVILNRSFGSKQLQYFERLEKFAVSNNISKKLVDSAFEKHGAFRSAYGNRRILSKSLFGSRLGSIEADLNAALEKQFLMTESDEDKAPEIDDEDISLSSGAAEHAEMDIPDNNSEEKQLSLFGEADKISVSSEKIRHNFHITNENLGEGGAKSKYHANVEAIKLLKKLEAENRLASPEEQETLSEYVGWGGIAQAFDENNEKWSNEYSELKNLLSPEEYESAKGSVLNAHFTSPTVIDAVYKALENNGFKGGNILEPAMGIGNFFGRMPEKMIQNSSLYGVELDSISGRIAKQLYQSADICINGFEKTDFNDNTFDLAVGNVPFGGYSLNEKKYNKYHFHIHDHFFAKALDKVKPNGIVAFVTSKGTLDKKNPAVRKYLAERAELVGAVRLPNNAFKANAGTEVTTDIIFLQKRENSVELTPETTPEWVDLGINKDGFAVNQYFAENPDMVLGRIVQGNKLYGHGSDDTSCIPFENSDLKSLLNKAVSNIHFDISNVKVSTEKIVDEITEIPLGVKNFSYAVINNNIYYRMNNEMQKFSGNKSDEERIKGLVEIRDCLRELISSQMENADDETVHEYQKQLSDLYDKFTQKHGYINSKQNQKAFKEDSSLPLISSLEEFKGDEYTGKASIFEKRTINPKVEITSTETAAEALALSLAEKACVDMEYMQDLTGFSAEKIMTDLEGVLFENPMLTDENGKPHLETADEYLSGNIRKKLEFMQKNYSDNSKYANNTEALKNALPKPLQAADIDIKLGATWLSPQIIQEFMYENLKTPVYCQEKGYKSYGRSHNIKIEFSPYTAEWSVVNKASDRNNKAANAKFGTARITAYEQLENCLNLRSTVIRDKVERNGKDAYVLNQKETDFAQEKQKELQECFKNWIFANPERREKIVEQYNVLFNSTRPREYDGSHLEFPGMNNEITLRPHQRNAVAHALYGGNTLFAHEVGAGKTYEMIAAAMEGKRLGLHHKALLCVPNHLTEQIGSDFIKLYPNANILVASSSDFTKANRRKLFAKIATGDYDAVIIGHSQLVKLPISLERQEKLLRNQIDEIVEGIAALKAENGESFQIKQMEQAKKSLETKLSKLLDAPVRDDVVNFEELGVDKLIVDEAHLFKNLFLSTKMRNISGISTNDNIQKTFDLLLKCQYLDEITGGKGIIFATGTPVSNSISEIYSMMKYLQADRLEETGLKHFDAWAANFAETVTESQLSPEGNSYQLKTRFAKFNNMPELMSLFKECADIKTADMLNLKIPRCITSTIIAQPTETQKDLIFALGERAKLIRLRKVAPTDDNMPMITNDGRKIGLDQRLMNPDLPDEAGTKINLCVDNVFNIWKETSDKRSAQLIFSDLGVPQTADKKSSGKRFCVYDDIKEKLIAKGVPAEEIAFIHDAKTETAKDKLFEKVRKGDVRVLIGSTSKMGAGTNVQNKLIASHDLDAPWKPSDMEQRRGRMVRQGNENDEVRLFRYVTEGTFDSYLYQMLENKQKFISQIMTSKSPVRSCQDMDEVALSYAEVKALSAGNPLIKEKMDLDVDVAKLRMLKASYQNAQFDLQDSVFKSLPKQIKNTEKYIQNLKMDIEAYSSRPVKKDDEGQIIFQGIEINGTLYNDKKEGGEALLEAFKNVVMKNISGKTSVGTYQGFEIKAMFDALSKCYVAELHGYGDYTVQLGSSETGNFTRLDNLLNSMQTNCENAKERYDNLCQQLEDAKQQLDKPFSREEELRQKEARLKELTKLLDIDSQNEIKTAEITAPYYIEINSEMLEKMKNSSINFEHIETDGHLILKINESDKDRVHDIIDVPALKPKI